MLEIIENLGKWCNNHKMDEKVILINDLKEGHKILKNLSINNYSYINLYVKKIEDIAEESIKTMVIRENKEIISKTIAIDLITNLLKNLKENQQLKYFEELIIDYEISKIFYELIIELKLEKVDLKSLQDFNNNNKKLQDIQLIIDEYNKELEVKNYLDKADIHILALEKGNLGTDENKHYISLYDETISNIEKEIIEKLIIKDEQEDITYNLNKHKNDKTQDSKLIKDILENIKNNNLEDKNNIELFCGYGESNELYEIVRKIKELNANFEDIAIYHTDDEKYTQRMYELSQLMDIPVSFEDGISISNTREANLIYKLVEWVKSDYRDDVLYELVDYLYLEKGITQFQIKNMLKELNIGFGKDRYKNIEDRIKYGEIIRDLETLLKILKLNNNNQNTFEGIDKIEEKITKPQIKNILSKLNEEFNKETDTNIDEKYKYSEVVKGLEKILKILKLKNNNNKDIFNINKFKNESENESNDEFKDEYAINLKDKEELDLIFMIIKYIESNYKNKNLPTLENYICKDETKVEDINNENTEKNELNDLINKINQNNNYKDKLDKARKLQDIINKLIHNIPDNETTYTEVINGLINILKKFKSKNKKLKSYNQNIFEVFEELKYINEELNINKILENIEKEVRAIKINITKSNDKNGKILFSHYKNGYYNDRKYHFIVGLDSNKFPIKIHENPILLDDEKKQINNNLMLAENLPNKEKLQMLDLIDTRDGKVYISYCNFDFKENKENTPSHLFLELARIVYNETSLSYKDLNKRIGKADRFKVHGFTDEKLDRCLSSREKWLNHHLNSTDISIEKFKEYKSNEDNKTLNEIDGYKNLYKAFINKNNEEVFDEYDGKVKSEELKIIGKKEKSMSPTQIKDFIVCPYKYYLKRELKLYDHKPRALDYNKWLKSHEFGILMHEVFEEFYKDIIDNNKELDKSKAEDDIKKIAKRLKIEFVNTYPSLRNMIYEDTCKSIDSICENFIEKELENKDLKNKKISTAEYVEYEFGNYKREVSINISEDKNKEQLLYINGKIDRIDKNKDNEEYKIIDYKSGKGDDHRFRKYKDVDKRDDLKRGKNIQNIIYAIASKTLIGENAEIKDTAYYLVNNGDENIEEIELIADEVNIEKCKAILREMAYLIEQGCFVKCYSKDKASGSCRYCEYKNICEFEYDNNIQINKLLCSTNEDEKKENIKGRLAFYGE